MRSGPRAPGALPARPPTRLRRGLLSFPRLRGRDHQQRGDNPPTRANRSTTSGSTMERNAIPNSAFFLRIDGGESATPCFIYHATSQSPKRTMGTPSGKRELKNPSLAIKEVSTRHIIGWNRHSEGISLIKLNQQNRTQN